jgi:hypothetical protein
MKGRGLEGKEVGREGNSRQGTDTLTRQLEISRFNDLDLLGFSTIADQPALCVSYPRADPAASTLRSGN